MDVEPVTLWMPISDELYEALLDLTQEEGGEDAQGREEG